MANDSSSLSSASSTSSIASRLLRRTATRESIDLDGQLRAFTLEQLCDFIAKHPSLESARIVICCSYRQRSAFYSVTHRFLVLQISRPGRDDVWLRLDRGRSAEVGLAEFASNLGVTSANDMASLSRASPKKSRAEWATGKNSRHTRGATPRLADSRKHVGFQLPLLSLSPPTRTTGSYDCHDPVQTQ